LSFGVEGKGVLEGAGAGGVIEGLGDKQGRMEGGSRGVKCPPSPPKKISSLDFFFQNFWLPSLKNTSWASYFSKELASITHVEALPWFQ
jgi:hypothetical protein